MLPRGRGDPGQLGVTLDVRRAGARADAGRAADGGDRQGASRSTSRVLIMDEPTASLSAHEVRAAVQHRARRCAARASPSSTSATAWRRSSRSPTGSRCCATASTISTAPARRGDARTSIIRDMVGREIDDCFAKREPPSAATSCCRCADLRRGGRVRTASTSTCARARCWASPGWSARAHRCRPGAVRHRAGDGGRDRARTASRVTIRSPRQAMALGIAYVSEDRRQLGLSMPMSIATNITLPALPTLPQPASAWSPHGRGRHGRGAFRERLRDPHAVASTSPVGAAVRRQPAEGDAGQVAGHAARRC